MVSLEKEREGGRERGGEKRTRGRDGRHQSGWRGGRERKKRARIGEKGSVKLKTVAMGNGGSGDGEEISSEPALYRH